MPNAFPALAIDELAALEESISRFGVLVPIVVDLEGNVIDGNHRLDLATELGVKHPLTVIAATPSNTMLTTEVVHKSDTLRPGLTERVRTVIERFPLADRTRCSVYEVETGTDLAEVARSLNLDRRHLTPEQRRSFVAELRAQGKSTRAIAAATGVCQTQVLKDIKQVNTWCSPVDLMPGEPYVSPDGVPCAPIVYEMSSPDDKPTGPPTVMGIDGKLYKRRKTTKPKKPKRPEVALAAHCLRFIETQGWDQFEQIVTNLAESYASKSG